MAFKAFTSCPVFERPPDPKDSFSILCLDCDRSNLYIGTRQGTVHRLALPSAVGRGSDPSLARETNSRKAFSSPLVRLRLAPPFSLLIALCRRALTVLSALTLETNAGFRKIQNVSLFELCHREDGVWMISCPAQRRLIRLHSMGVDRWDVLREISLVQEPLALAVDGGSACLGTRDQYLLCDLGTGRTDQLLQHGLGGQHVLVSATGVGEFLINGPGGLGLCVLASGVCQRPPLAWPRDILAACVCLPYVLSLQAQGLEVYSLLDQRCKQSVSLSGALGLVSTADGALVFTDQAVFRLSAVPGQQQIQALMQEERLEEALQLLEAGLSQDSPEEHKELQRSLTCAAGFQHFFQGRFTEARDLFIKGDLDPRELLRVFPGLSPAPPADSGPRERGQGPDPRERDLRELWRTDHGSELLYLGFLRDFLRGLRERGSASAAEVDSALLWLHVRMADGDGLLQLVAEANACQLDTCEGILTRGGRFFALGRLYLSHGQHQDAIQTWVNIVEGVHRDPSCSGLLELIVSTLSQMEDRGVVWTYAPWALHQDQELGVQIFTKRHADDQYPPEDVLELLETHTRARTTYLESLIYDSNSEKAGHHTALALAYVSLSLQGQEEDRAKLQRLLWDSRRYDVSAVHERLQPTPLHLERAIVLGRLGDHSGALTVLVQNCPDPAAVEEFCLRDDQSRRSLLPSLLNIYLSGEGRSGAAPDLLNRHSHSLWGEEVLEVLPESWSVQLVSGYLAGSMRETLHQRRMTQVQRALEHVQLLRHKALWMQVAGPMLTLDGGQSCDACHKPLSTPHFVRAADGGLLHLDCANHSATALPRSLRSGNQKED